MSQEQMALPAPLPRKLMFAKDVDQKSIEELSEAILQINSNDAYLSKIYKIHGLKYTPKPIKIYIDSYGGWVYQIMGLISIIRNSKTPVHTFVTGCAMSCGFLLLINGHKRYAYPLSTVLYHQVSGGTWGKIQDIEETAAEYRRLQESIEQMTLELTIITKKKLKEIHDKKIDWFISAQDALELGIIDKILE